MQNKINKTTVGSVIYLDIVEYSKQSTNDQMALKNTFNAILNTAIEEIDKNDCIILDSGDGVSIAYVGPPEDILNLAINVINGIVESNEECTVELCVRIGINLGPICVITDVNDRPNIVGDGINVAQRIMSFASKNQILASRSYYEVTSRLTEDIFNLYEYHGVKKDKHVREHEIYRINSRLSEKYGLHSNST